MSFLGILYRKTQEGKGFPCGSDGKETACNAGEPGLIHGSGKIPWRKKSQYSCLENSMDRGAWQATVHVIVKSQTD